MTKQYHYKISSGEYFSGDLPAGVDLDDYATTLLLPPDILVNQAVIFEGEQWVVKPDYRGVEFWSPIGKPFGVSEIGDVPPANVLTACHLSQEEILQRISPEQFDIIRWTAARAVETHTVSEHQLAMLQAEADAAGETLSEVIDLILATAQPFNPKHGSLEGLRRKYFKRIAECETCGEANALFRDYQDKQAALNEEPLA